ncbi:MAG: hypothetical protein KTM48_01175, partial [Wolbachia endosymbiont of Pissodes strobi]|nr:hypothetical protein [Wolbachia endosymbiont of Pissodes strobi]
MDDIFAIFDTKTANVEDFVTKLNNRFPTIKFTYEVENNGQLPFLDTLVIRNDNNTLEFDIYRKNTATNRYIPNDSFHCDQHKMASFHFLVHRLVNFPLSRERFNNEKETIRNIAKVNGFNTNLINKLINRHLFRKTIRDSTSFVNQDENTKYVSIPYNPQYTRGLQKVFKEVGLKLVYQ